MINKSKKIAVVGGGIFGVTAAIFLARKGYKVDLFERRANLLEEASGLNQYRLHRGYHYPRSSETVLSLLRAEPKFREEYKEAIIDDVEHYYCIAKEGSLTSAKDYLEFCRSHGLEFEITDCPVVQKEKIDLCIKTKESLFDAAKLRDICWERLKNLGVNVFLRKEVSLADLDGYDFVVTAVYANQGSMLERTPRPPLCQFEVCEKPVVRLPESFRGKSIMIMDGPFMCVDPLGKTGLFVLGNVVHAIHESNVGLRAEVSSKLENLVNRGIVENPSVTKFPLFIESGARFIPELKKAKHVGSMFVVRTVLPFEEKTDARPTMVNYVNERTINIFSGKIANCVDAAQKVVSMIERMHLYRTVFSKKKIIKNATAFVLVLVAGYFFWKGLEGKDLFNSILVVNPSFLFYAFGFYLVSIFWKAVRFRYFLGKKLKFSEIFSITAANSFWNNVLPLRAGELSYIYLVKRSGVVTDGENITSLLLSRLMDLFTVALLVSASSFFIFMREGALGYITVLAAVFLAIFLFSVLLSLVFKNSIWIALLRVLHKRFANYRFFSPLLEKAEDVLAATGRLKKPAALCSFLGLSFLVWTGDFLFVWAGISAGGASIGFYQAAFIAAFPVVASMVPIQTPAGIGTFESAVSAGLLMLGLPLTAAIGISILLHVQQLLFSAAIFALSRTLKYFN